MNSENAVRRRWKPWQKTLLICLIWTALVIGAGMLHTEVILGGKLSEAQDEKISGSYGMVCGAGLFGIVFVVFMRGRK